MNSHILKERGILSPLRLPIPPPRHTNLQIREVLRLILFLHCTVKDLISSIFNEYPPFARSWENLREVSHRDGGGFGINSRRFQYYRFSSIMFHYCMSLYFVAKILLTYNKSFPIFHSVKRKLLSIQFQSAFS